MAKSIASLQAVVGAQITAYERQMKRVAEIAKDKARAIDRTRATMRVDADIKPAQNKLMALKASMAKGGLTGALNPLQLGASVLSGSIMRAVTQSEEGQKFIENIDRVTENIIAPLLETLVPVVENLEPVFKDFGEHLSEFSASIPRITGQGGVVPRWVTQSANVASRVALATVTMGLSEAIPLAGQLFGGGGTPTSAAGGSGGGSAGGAGAFGFLTHAANLAAKAIEAMAGAAATAAAAQKGTLAAAQGWQGTLQGLTNVQAQIAALQPGASPLAGALVTAQQQFNAGIAHLQIKEASRQADLNAAIASGDPARIAAAQDALLETLRAINVAATSYNKELEKAKAAQAALSAAQKAAANRMTADQLNAAATSPLERFQAEMSRLNALMAGPSGLSAAGYNSAVAAAFATLQGATGSASMQGIGLLQQGSAEAQAAINQFNRQGGQANIQEQIKAVMEAAARSGAATAASAAELVRILTRGGVVMAPTRALRP